MGLREDIEALVEEIGTGSFTAGSAHVARELRVILERHHKPKHEARPPHPLTMAGKGPR